MITVGSLCTGVGGLELGLTMAGVDHRVGFVADIDPNICRWLDTRHPDVPNVGDITTIDDLPRVDLITAGFPCQGNSTAGNRKGLDDDRWIWDDVARLVGRMDPRPDLFLENVPGLLTVNGGHALARVVSSLAQLGYVGTYGVLSAADVGACHLRRRWWCVATHPDSVRRVERPRPRTSEPTGLGRHGSRDHRRAVAADPAGVGGGPAARQPEPEDGTDSDRRRTPQPGRRGAAAAEAGGDDAERRRGPERMAGSQGAPREQGAGGDESEDASRGGSEADADSHGIGLSELGSGHRGDSDRRGGEGSRRDELAEVFGGYAAAIERWESVIGRPVPHPRVEDERHLSHYFVEWMQGYPAGWVTDVLDDRRPALHALGNAPVPLCAAHAWTQLSQRLDAQIGAAA